MPSYIRAAIPGATFFFTVALEDRRALWRLPEGDANFAMRWMLVKTRFTRRLRQALAQERRRARHEVKVWQDRYWQHLVRDDEDYANHVNYIHFNPVKHGHVLRAADWPHSSFHRWVKEGRLPADWGLAREVEGRFGE